MISEYEINPSTLAIIPIDLNKTMVYEFEDEFIVDKSSMEIVDNSCKYYGSSYIGRFEGTKTMVGYKYKAPIIIEETTKMIFFPTNSPRLKNCSWISLKHIDSYNKIGKSTIINFKNKKQLLIDISQNVVETQILRSTKLWGSLQEKFEILKK